MADTGTATHIRNQLWNAGTADNSRSTTAKSGGTMKTSPSAWSKEGSTTNISSRTGQSRALEDIHQATKGKLNYRYEFIYKALKQPHHQYTMQQLEITRRQHHQENHMKDIQDKRKDENMHQYHQHTRNLGSTKTNLNQHKLFQLF